MMSDCGNVKKVFVPVDKETQKTVSQEKPVTPAGFSVSEKAAEKILHFCTIDKKSPQEYGLKVSVVND